MSRKLAGLSRRQFLATASVVTAAAAVPAWVRGQDSTSLPPVRQVTRGPKFHWFAYYDKLQFDPTGRYLLGMEVDFEHRSPRPDDVIKVGLVDLAQRDQWIELGQSTAWCWQQGCMLQWRPGSDREILWNDRQGDRYVCHILDVRSRKKRTIPHPVYSVSPDGRWAVAPDFRRVNDCRPGYGYVGPADPFAAERAPKQSGIWRIDLESGKHDLVVTLADIAKIPYPHGDLAEAKQWFNHLLINTDGTRFEFLHRWRFSEKGPLRTRMLTAAPDGSDVQMIDDNGLTSHFIWRDPKHILAWSGHESKRGNFCLFEDRTGGKVEVIGRELMPRDGHCSYLPGNEWILCDAYPEKKRNQNVYLYHVPTNRRVELGGFHSPPEYVGEWRCDTHPRYSPDGNYVVIDSPHHEGRQLHLIDIRGIVRKA